MLRIGLIGCGGIVRQAHAIGYRSMADRIQVTALADPSSSNRSQAGLQLGVSQELQFADHLEMLKQAPLDAVVIATPHAFHAEHVVAAAEAGKAIISEKPMAVSLDEADSILTAVEKYDVPYTVVHNLLWVPAVAGARQLLASGQLGRPLLGRGEMLAHKSTATTTTDQNWRASARMGGGALIDSSYHEIYTVEALMASPIRSVYAQLATLRFPIDVDDTALLTFEHENGCISNVVASWCARSPAHRGRWTSVSATDGAVRIIYTDPLPLAVFQEDGSGPGSWERVEATDIPGIAMPVAGDTTGHASYLQAAVDAIESGGEVPVSGLQARHNLAIVEAARKSNSTKRTVEVA